MKNLIFFLFLLIQVQASAQAPRKLKQDTRFELKIENPSLVLTPFPMDSSTKYPVIVFLPYTGGTAKDYYNIYLSQVLGEPGEMAYEELELYLNHFADSLKRIPTEDEIFEYMQDLKAKADRNTPAENRKFNSLLQMLFGDDVKNKAFIAVIPSGTGSANDHNSAGCRFIPSSIYTFGQSRTDSSQCNENSPSFSCDYPAGQPTGSYGSPIPHRQPASRA